MKQHLLLFILLLASSQLGLAQNSKKPAPPDLVTSPLVPADISQLPAGMERVDVFLLMGQSNMKGRGVMPDKPLQDPQIVMLHKRTDEWFLARHPLHLVGDPVDFSGADNAGVGPGLAFAQTLAKKLPKTRIALIPCALGGTRIEKWQKGQRLYEETVRRARLALQQGPAGKTRIAGALWLQGEADSNSPELIAAYPKRIEKLITDLRADLELPNLPFIACTIGELKAGSIEAREAINDILLELPDRVHNTACVDSRAFAEDIGDGVHFDTPTQEKHGRLYAEAYLRLSAADSGDVNHGMMQTGVAATGLTVPKLPENRQPNVLLLCIDDLRPELNSFGVSYMHTPNIDQLASQGRPFYRHYVNAPTCGASRYTMLTGRYGQYGNNALFERARKLEAMGSEVPPSMPEWFRRNGYTTVSVGKVSHHPGGWGGDYWNDRSIIEMPGAWDRQLMPVGEWEHPRGAMHGLAHGEIKTGLSFTESKLEVMQSVEGPDTIYNDGLIADEGERQLEQLAASDKPFFLAIGLIKPHLPFGSPKAYMAPYKSIDLPPIPHPQKPDWPTTWHDSGEFFNQYYHHGRDPRQDTEYADLVRKHYAACVTYVDKHVGDILARLRKTGRDRDTIVVLWGDHGWHLGEHAIWGKHCLFEEALRSPLIIRVPDMRNPGAESHAIVETLDLFPTLAELAGLAMPGHVHGKSLVSQVGDPDAAGHAAYSYTGKAWTVRTDSHRMILHKDGYVELYDHRSKAGETRNVAEQNPRLVEELKRIIQQKRVKQDEY